MVFADFVLNPEPSTLVALHDPQSQIAMASVEQVVNHFSQGQICGIKFVEVLVEPLFQIATSVVVDAIVGDRNEVVEKLLVAFVTEDGSGDLVGTDYVVNGISTFASELTHLIWSLKKSQAILRLAGFLVHE